MTKLHTPSTGRYEIGECMPQDHVDASLEIFDLYGRGEVLKLVTAIGSQAVRTRGGSWLQFDTSKFDKKTASSVRVLSEWFTDVSNKRSVRGHMLTIQRESTNFDLHPDSTTKVTTAISRLQSVGTMIFPNVTVDDFDALLTAAGADKPGVSLHLEPSQNQQDLKYSISPQNGQMVMFSSGVYHQEPLWDIRPDYNHDSVRALFSAG